MSKFWNDTLTIGIKEIDDQHKAFIEKMEHFHQACLSGKGNDELKSMLKDIEDYVKHHFQTEEALHRKHNYPDIESHKKMHDKYVANLERLKHEYFKKGSNVMVVIKFQTYLSDWFINHVKSEDKKFGKFLTASKSGVA